MEGFVVAYDLGPCGRLLVNLSLHHFS